jgi:hypothetical protein
MIVIPGRRQRVRPEVAGPMVNSAASPESITAEREFHRIVTMDSGQPRGARHRAGHFGPDPLARLPE